VEIQQMTMSIEHGPGGGGGGGISEIYFTGALFPASMQFLWISWKKLMMV
jgi:hypothetical protein